MSRNIGQTNCAWCSCDEVELIGPDRLIAKDDAGRYFDEYRNMVVADAECFVCGAKYLAWVDERFRIKYPSSRGKHRAIDGVKAFFDLSYREAFNDEPAEGDVGLKDVRLHLRNLRRYLAEFT